MAWNIKMDNVSETKRKNQTKQNSFGTRYKWHQVEHVTMNRQTVWLTFTVLMVFSAAHLQWVTFVSWWKMAGCCICPLFVISDKIKLKKAKKMTLMKMKIPLAMFASTGCAWIAASRAVSRGWAGSPWWGGGRKRDLFTGPAVICGTKAGPPAFLVAWARCKNAFLGTWKREI